MPIYVYLEDGEAVCSNVKPIDSEYLVVDEIPFGTGKLCTDLQTVWREDPPKKVIEVPKLDPQIQALSDRQEFLEDCIAEMAMEVYK